MKKTNVNSENCEIRKQEFNMYKNTLRRLITQAKKLYFSGQFNKQRDNGRKTWQTIDNALHRKPHKSSPDDVLINGGMCNDKRTWRMHLMNTLLLFVQITIHAIILFLTLTILMPLFIQRLNLRQCNNSTILIQSETFQQLWT